jgi:lipoyl(octanoyl) transferase
MNNAGRKIWRLISDPPRRGALNMEIDDALLRHLEESDVVATIVRFYEWERPTLSLGQHQKVELAADLDFCRAHRIEIVHRPTGGRAVLHDQELTYAVVSSDKDIFSSTSVLGTYKQIARGLCRGLRRLGVKAVLADAPTHALEAPQNPVTVKHPCFNSPSKYELMVGQRKLVGSAQKRLQRGFLQHGSLLLDCSIPVLARATRGDERALAQSITTLREVLGRPANRREVEQALLEGMEEEFSILFEVQPLTEEEMMGMLNSKNKISHRVSA